MTTLTDRYIWAVVRSLPQDQRDDIDRELRASIGDDIEARIEGGVDAPAAEREALLSLGDPHQLAASYAGRPSFLLGPRYYFDYLRLLRLLLAIVIPAAAFGMVLAQAISGKDIGEIIGGTIVVLITVTVHLAFWTTIVFVIIERNDRGRKAEGVGWTPETLPQIPDPKAGAGLSELIASVVFLVVFAGALLWQHFFSVFADAEGAPVPLLQPQLWHFWIPYVLVLIALEVAFAFAIYLRHGWNWLMAGLNVVLNLAFVLPAVWLITNDYVFNREYLARFDWDFDSVLQVLTPLMIVLLAGIALWDIIDGILKARRATMVA